MTKLSNTAVSNAKSLLLSISHAIYFEVRVEMKKRGLSHVADATQKRLAKSLDKAAKKVLLHSPPEVWPEMTQERALAVVGEVWPEAMS